MACFSSVIGGTYIYICMELEVCGYVIGDIYIYIFMRICIYRVFRVTEDLGFE